MFEFDSQVIDFKFTDSEFVRSINDRSDLNLKLEDQQKIDSQNIVVFQKLIPFCKQDALQITMDVDKIQYPIYIHIERNHLPKNHVAQKKEIANSREFMDYIPSILGSNYLFLFMSDRDYFFHEKDIVTIDRIFNTFKLGGYTHLDLDFVRSNLRCYLDSQESSLERFKYRLFLDGLNEEPFKISDKVSKYHYGLPNVYDFNRIKPVEFEPTESLSDLLDKNSVSMTEYNRYYALYNGRLYQLRDDQYPFTYSYYVVIRKDQEKICILFYDENINNDLIFKGLEACNFEDGIIDEISVHYGSMGINRCKFDHLEEMRLSDLFKEDNYDVIFFNAIDLTSVKNITLRCTIFQLLERIKHFYIKRSDNTIISLHEMNLKKNNVLSIFTSYLQVPELPASVYLLDKLSQVLTFPNIDAARGILWNTNCPQDGKKFFNIYRAKDLFSLVSIDHTFKLGSLYYNLALSNTENIPLFMKRSSNLADRYDLNNRLMLASTFRPSDSSFFFTPTLNTTYAATAVENGVAHFFNTVSYYRDNYSFASWFSFFSFSFLVTDLKRFSLRSSLNANSIYLSSRHSMKRIDGIYNYYTSYNPLNLRFNFELHNIPFLSSLSISPVFYLNQFRAEDMFKSVGSALIIEARDHLPFFNSTIGVRALLSHKDIFNSLELCIRDINFNRYLLDINLGIDNKTAKMNSVSLLHLPSLSSKSSILSKAFDNSGIDFNIEARLRKMYNVSLKRVFGLEFGVVTSTHILSCTQSCIDIIATIGPSITLLLTPLGYAIDLSVRIAISKNGMRVITPLQLRKL